MTNFFWTLQRPQPQKPVLVSSPCENVFCTSNTKHDRRLMPKPKVYCGKNITGTKASTTIICPGFNSQWRWFLKDKHDKRTVQTNDRPTIKVWDKKQVKKMLTCLKFPCSNTARTVLVNYSKCGTYDTSLMLDHQYQHERRMHRRACGRFYTSVNYYQATFWHTGWHGKITNHLERTS